MRYWIAMGTGFTQTINGITSEFRVCMSADVEPKLSGVGAVHLVEKSEHEAAIAELKSRLAEAEKVIAETVKNWCIQPECQCHLCTYQKESAK